MNDRWVMPARYYSKRVEIGSTGHFISFIFLDASPCQADYRGSDSSKWDPCGGDYPGPSDCKFHENVLAQDCGEQLAWLKTAVTKIPDGDWKIAVSHAPFDELDVEDLTGVLQNASFDLYLNGHVHNLAQYELDARGTYIQSGAGCMVEIRNSKLEEAQNPAKVDKHAAYRASRAAQGLGHSYRSLWENKIAGFTTHTFSSDLSELTTTFVDNNGNDLHTVTTKRGGGPTPSPGPGPGPSPTGKCCYYSDSSCSAGDVCCKSGCKDPSSCSYSQYGCEGKYGSKHNCQWDGGECIVGNNRLAQQQAAVFAL